MKRTASRKTRRRRTPPCREVRRPPGLQRGPCARAEDGLEAVEQGSGRVAQVLRPAADGRVQEKDQRSGDDEGGEAPDGCSWNVALGIVRLLGGKRQLLDREIEPDGERD